MGNNSRKEIIDFVLNFDKVAAVRMSLHDQASFIAMHFDELHNIPIKRDGYLFPWSALTTLFKTSFRIWNLYRPEFLATIPYEHQAILAEIGVSYEKTSAIYRLIQNSPDILPPESRALFCAARMRGYRWQDEQPLFSTEYTLMCLQYQERGIARPEYPSAFSHNSFYKKFPSYFAANLPHVLSNAINADNIAQFAIALSVCNLTLSKNLLLYALANNATNILIANLNSFKHHLPFDSLILYCTSSVEVSTAIPLMTAIEENEPGAIRNAKDIFSNNALWYTFYRSTNLNFYQSISQNEDFESISRFLLDNGVSPDAANCLDLTYSSMRKAQTTLSKIAD